MSVKVMGTPDRLALELPGEGETWVRDGDTMVGAPVGSGGGADSQDEFKQAGGVLSPTKAHSDIEGDALDPSTFTLAAGTTDGFLKSIRFTANPSGGSILTAAFRVTGGSGTQPTQINFASVGDAALLVWQAATSKWVIRLLVGDATATNGPP